MALALAAATVLAAPGPAAAHAALVTTTPADGATVEDLDTVVLRFASPVEPAASHLWLDGDTIIRTPLGPATTAGTDARAITVEVPPLPKGAYRLGFHVLAADGADVTGSVRFGLGVPPPTNDTSGSSLPVPLTDVAGAAAAVLVAAVGVVAIRRSRKEPLPT